MIVHTQTCRYVERHFVTAYVSYTYNAQCMHMFFHAYHIVYIHIYIYLYKYIVCDIYIYICYIYIDMCIFCTYT